MSASVRAEQSTLKVPEMFTPIRRSFDSFKLDDGLGHDPENSICLSSRSAARGSHARVSTSPSPELLSQTNSCSSYPSSSPVFGSPMLRRRKGGHRATSPTPPGTTAPTPAVGGSRWSWARLSLRTVQAFRSAGQNRRRRVSRTDGDDEEEDEEEENGGVCTAATPFLQRTSAETRDLRREAQQQNEPPNVFQRAVQQIVHQVRVINAFRDSMFRRMMVVGSNRVDALTPPPPLPAPVRAWQATTTRILFQLRVVRAFRDGMLRRVLEPSPEPTTPQRRLWVRAVRHVVFQLRVARAFQEALLEEERRQGALTPPLRTPPRPDEE